MFSLVAVVTSLVIYHVTQRAMPHHIRPAPLFAFVYGVAMVAMLGMAAVDRAGAGGVATEEPRADGVVAQLQQIGSHWAPWLLALGVSGIELGVYAMYRSGWPVATASITSQSIAVTLLAVIGLVAFGEQMTPMRLVGLLLCTSGAGLLTR